ncbi:aldo/keto reductase [Natronorubrum halophilum]|uniref:aldo/keto reductase n=1 Tax=Natronorubrum halophilum TaxID=1702106 RepID=UPI0010C17AE1|nr:aldo/keto reductase [Natronorubrum halophilum]
MEYRRLGATGLTVSPLCLGTWRFGKESNGMLETDRETARNLLDEAWDKGINFIDTANSYGGGKSEQWIGEWLADHDREDFVIASKVWWRTRGGPETSLSRKSIRLEIQGTLERLDTNYLDVYYIHRFDDGTPIREMLRTLDDLVREGTVRYLAASAGAGWKLTKALWQSDRENLERFEITQPRFNAAYREAVEDYLDVCADQELAVCPYSPLEGGFLTGKYDRNGDPPAGSRGDRYEWNDRFDERQWRVLEAVRAVAAKIGATPAQVALRWCMDRERFTCVPIVGARSVDQLEENAGSMELSLTDDQLRQITDAYGADAGGEQ